jgi:hypothetical protein
MPAGFLPITQVLLGAHPSDSGFVVASLPTVLRPTANLTFAVISHNANLAHRVDVMPNGNLVVSSCGVCVCARACMLCQSTDGYMAYALYAVWCGLCLENGRHVLRIC